MLMTTVRRTSATKHSRQSRDALAADAERVARVRAFAKKHLGGMKRPSGGDYAVHGREIAKVMKEVTDDPTLLNVAMLHDLPLHPDGERLLREAPLNREERELVRKMHALRHLQLDRDMEALNNALHAFIDEPRLLPLRITHRLVDIRMLRDIPGKLRTDLARETLSMYCAFAERLGMNRWRHEMEDGCFAYLYPKETAEIRRLLKQSEAQDRRDLSRAKAAIQRELKARGINAEIVVSRKCVYTTYTAMQRERKAFGELHDRLKLLVLTEDVQSCYGVLGVAHSLFHPMPGALKDYVSVPKDNGYQSVDTAVYPLAGVTRQPLRVNIRTRAMHEACEFGIERGGRMLHTCNSWLDMLRYLNQRKGDIRTPKQFAAVLRSYFGDGITIYDGNASMYRLQPPVSALDFACHVYGDSAARLHKIFRNCMPCPRETLLSDGDIVDVTFASETKLRPDWLKACRHRSSVALLGKLLAEMK